MKRNILIFSAVSILAVAAVAQTGRTRLEARLTGDAKGKAKWQTRGARQAELEFEGERLVPATPYVVTVVGRGSWPVSTNALGRFSLEQRFTTANRPAIVSGDVVVVSNAAGVTVMSGTLRPR